MVHGARGSQPAMKKLKKLNNNGDAIISDKDMFFKTSLWNMSIASVD